MYHLRSFRLGWQSQNIAQFLLYKLAFLSEPVYVGDDVGADYFCTLFEPRKNGNNTDLIPCNSFAIQIKSESTVSQLDISGYLPYLVGLEVPYFIGVVDRDKLQLTVYSGELLPALFAYRGIPQHLEATLCVSSTLRSDYAGWHSEIRPGNYSLLFPEAICLNANDNDHDLQQKAYQLKTRCSIMLKNIASIKNKEFILKGMAPGQVLLFAGPDSFNHYEDNFLQRLIEAFYNLNWAYDALPNDRTKNAQKFGMYEKVYLQISSDVGEFYLPGLLLSLA
jgi:hypothetical protein